MRNLCLLIVFVSFAHWFSMPATAGENGNVVDRVYHPYILPFERELEWRFMSRRSDEGNALVQRIAFGHAVSEYTLAEFYLVAARDETDNFDVEGYEIELRHMLTEQGKYWADWGVLAELEKKIDGDVWETTVGLIMEKEIYRTSLTVNTMLVYPWGPDVVDQELKAELRLKYRYRWIPQFQPAIEFYSGDDFMGIGPAFMGIQRFDSRRQLKWELGFIKGFNGDTKDYTLRFALEYEF